MEILSEKNNKELAETKQYNMNLKNTIDKLKLNYDIEITKYKNKICDYENQLKEYNIYPK